MKGSQAVSIQNACLHGDWLLPDASPSCIALIIAGSGPTDADGNQSGLVVNNLRDLADALAEHGIATLRTDKRGVGRSAGAIGDESQLSFDTYVEDAVQWIRWVQDQHGQLPVVLLGHSEGALIATLATKRIAELGLEGISGVAALCAPARRAIDILRNQLVGRLPPHLEKISNSMLNALELGQSCPPCPDELMVLYRPSVQPYLRSWFQYDPQQCAAQLACQYLWIWGEADEQVASEHLHLTNGQAHRLIADMDHAMHSSGIQQLHPELIEAVVSFCNA